jgi:hypothetical protein
VGRAAGLIGVPAAALALTIAPQDAASRASASRAAEIKPAPLRLVRTSQYSLNRDLERERIRDIESFWLTKSGTIQFVRREGDRDGFSIVSLDAKGQVTRDPRLEIPAGVEPRGLQWAPLGDAYLFASYSTPVPTEMARYCVLSISDGKLVKDGMVEQIKSVRSVTRVGDGSLAIHGEAHRLDFVVLYDAKLEAKWTFSTGEDTNPPFLSLGRIVNVGDSTVAILDQSGTEPHLFSVRDGARSRVDLTKDFHLSTAVPDATGCLSALGTDTSRGQQRIFRFLRSGDVKEIGIRDLMTTRRVFEDNCASIANDQSMWISDGMALTRFDSHGRVTDELGPKVTPDSLTDIGSACIDSSGNLVIQDQRSAAILYFDGKGTLRRSVRMDASDFPTITPFPWIMPFITADGRGNVYIQCPLRGNNVRVSADGSSKLLEKTHQGAIEYNCRTGDHCVRSPVATTHYFADGRAPIELDPEPPKNQSRRVAAPLDDGSVLTLCTMDNEFRPAVSFYGPGGNLEMFLPLNVPALLTKLSVGKHWVALSGFAQGYLIDLATRTARSIEPQPGTRDFGIYEYLVRVEPDGSETLLQVSVESRLVRTYKLPSP